jgi:hypothetical protein
MTASGRTQNATKWHSCVLGTPLLNGISNENRSREMNVMQVFACLLLMGVWFVVNTSLRRNVFHHPEAQGKQMAYAASRWLLLVGVLWWVVVLTPILVDRYLPDDILIDVDKGHLSNETTTEFLFPLLPSWSDKQ